MGDIFYIFYSPSRSHFKLNGAIIANLVIKWNSFHFKQMYGSPKMNCKLDTKLLGVPKTWTLKTT